MKKHLNFKKVFPTVVALAIVLTLGVTSGCGGCFGALGAISCVGGLIDSIKDGELSPITIKPGNSSSDNESPSSGTELPDDHQSDSNGSGQNSGNGSGQSGENGNSGESGELQLSYTEYDPADFNAMCEELTRLASGNDSAAIISQYEQILNEYKYIDENSSMLYVLYSCEPSSEYWSGQYQKDSSMATACLDTALTAVKAVCDGPCSDAFKDYVGEVDFDEFNEYEPMTEEEITIDDRITELVAEYYSDIEKSEEEGWSEEELNQVVGPLYLELVSLRNQYASFYGYDNFADFADEEIYNRDFDENDIEIFRNAVKKFSGRAYELMYYSSAYSAPYYLDIEMSTDELLDKLTYYGSLISPLAERSGDLLTSRKLYNIGNDSQRMDGAYTVTFEKSGVPYIFASVEGASGFVTMSHEFGHFTEATINHNPNPLLYGLGALELCEIHSNGLQGLYSSYYNDIYGEYAGEMSAYVVIDLLSNITEGCLFDEFQRAVYKNPDLTLDELNLLYRNICESYGSPTSTDDYWWMYVSHNFESPMYYFSYAASGYVALQIWAQSQIDYDGAVATWESIVNAGSYDYGYMELLDDLDIPDFTDTATVGVTCDQALNFVEQNSVSYSNGSSWEDEFNFPGGNDLENWLDDWLSGFGNIFGN